MIADSLIIALVGFLVVLCLLALLSRLWVKKPSIPVRSRAILTRAEIAFYERLLRAIERIGGVDVFPQVCMSAIIETTPGLDARERMAVRSKFNRKYVDFTIVDAATRPLLIVELDDVTHEWDKDAQRDAITAAAGVPTLRMRGSAARDEYEIERRVRSFLQS